MVAVCSLAVKELPQISQSRTALGTFASLSFSPFDHSNTNLGELERFKESVLRRGGEADPRQVEFSVNVSLFVRATLANDRLRVQVYRPWTGPAGLTAQFLNQQSDRAEFNRKGFGAPYIELKEGKIYELVSSISDDPQAATQLNGSIATKVIHELLAVGA